MATGKTWSVAVPITKEGGTWGHITAYFQEDYDAVNNYSTLKVTKITGSNTIRSGTFRTTGRILIDGNTWYSWGDYDWYFGGTAAFTCEFQPQSTAVYPSGLVIYHNDDGTKQISVSLEISSYWGSSPTWGGNGGTVTQSVALTTIPRASKISAGNGTLGTAQTLTVDRKSDSYTHTITYVCGSASGTVCEKSNSTNVVWTPPLSLAGQNTTGTNVTVTLTITTYSGSTQIGDGKTKTVTMTIPSSVGLKVSEGWATAAPYNTGTAAAGMNAYVQGYSKAKVSFDDSKISTANAYGATVKSYEITHEGMSNASSDLTGVLHTAGANTIICKVTDTRGRSVSTPLTITVEVYKKPTLSEITIFRCNSSGIESDEGTCISVTAKANISSIGELNTYTMQAQISGLSANAIDSEETAVLGAGAVLPTATYTVVLTLTDRLGNTVTYTQLIPTAEVMFHARAGGKGAAFGKYSETDDLLDVDWNLQVRKDVEVQGDTYLESGLEFNRKGTLEGYGGYVDFHYNGSTEDYTVRMIEDYERRLSIYAANGLYINGKPVLSALELMPVGYIYISTTLTSPASLFGGTWERIYGRFLYGVWDNQSGHTGGEETHYLSVNEMPYHTHGINVSNDGNPDGWADRSTDYTRQYWHTGYNEGWRQYNLTPTTHGSGAGAAHNNMPPWYGVYIWRRTA